MISFDFDYYKPGSIKEAVDTHKDLTEQGKTAIYYAGGTEIISQARVNQIYFDTVIDIKEIPECNMFESQANTITIGSAISLTKISDSSFFPLLNKVCRRAADHTARNKITIGGNICGKIHYSEAVLPLLLSDSKITIAGTDGIRTLPITQIFNNILRLNNGEFLVQIEIDKTYVDLPYINIKKTKQEKVDYPLISAASLRKNEKIKFAFSGLCAFPFRLPIIEEILNNNSIPLETRVEQMITHLPTPILNDMLGSAKYRKFVLYNILSEIFETLGGAK